MFRRKSTIRTTEQSTPASTVAAASVLTKAYAAAGLTSNSNSRVNSSTTKTNTTVRRSTSMLNTRRYNSMTIERPSTRETSRTSGSRTSSLQKSTSRSNSRSNSIQRNTMTPNNTIHTSPSMNTLSKNSRRASSLPSKKRVSSMTSKQHEEAQLTFKEFGGNQSTNILKPKTVRKYVPSAHGLVAIDVPVIENPKKESSSSVTRSTSVNHQLKRKVSQDSLHSSNKVNPISIHYKDTPLIETSMIEETETELKQDDVELDMLIGENNALEEKIILEQEKDHNNNENEKNTETYIQISANEEESIKKGEKNTSVSPNEEKETQAGLKNLDRKIDVKAQGEEGVELNNNKRLNDETFHDEKQTEDNKNYPSIDGPDDDGVARVHNTEEELKQIVEKIEQDITEKIADNDSIHDEQLEDNSDFQECEYSSIHSTKEDITIQAIEPLSLDEGSAKKTINNSKKKKKMKDVLPRYWPILLWTMILCTKKIDTADNNLEANKKKHTKPSEKTSSMAQYMRVANPYLNNESSSTEQLTPANSTVTDNIQASPSIKKGSIQRKPAARGLTPRANSLTRNSMPMKSALKKSIQNDGTSSSVYSDKSAATGAYLSLTTAENTRLNAQIADEAPPGRKRSISRKNTLNLTRPQSMINQQIPRSRSPLTHERAKSKRHSVNMGPIQKPRVKKIEKDVEPSSVKSNHTKKTEVKTSKQSPGAPDGSHKRNSFSKKSQKDLNSILYPKEPPQRKSSFEKLTAREGHLGFKMMSLRGESIVDSTNTENGTIAVDQRQSQNTDHVSNPVPKSSGWTSRFNDSDSEEEYNINSNQTPNTSIESKTKPHNHSFSFFKMNKTRSQESEAFSPPQPQYSNSYPQRSLSSNSSPKKTVVETGRTFSAHSTSINSHSLGSTMRNNTDMKELYPNNGHESRMHSNGYTSSNSPDEVTNKKSKVFSKKLKKLFGRKK
ncbi:hypothetical protein KAFR_0A00770 [Kazachstania africana CBS 2517]|uniref:Eisosome protein SEG2 n=1 Tax=Kazachstania africana (strain ATCC 22294 / BCRC 22015 / CBS 2517 / CECT 1963 / NBRC 1671 / NRRL Y-8276) TaxID=1071382 RepID=H2AMB5_KAZAF|nr:hypothetical protein KAFR_0A00770 [Kazachstania africana CBS 2517]CCF55515.1 hypothetical protein KAFR_0A00770 [Kazachstania africana CBS 2517]